MSIKSDSIWPASPTTTRGLPTQLSSDPKGERLAYASNKSVFLRSIDNPALSTQYTSHTAATTVARFSPSGYYVASGDASGTVRVWDCVGEGSTKGEYHIIGGRINDLAWDGDSARIIAVGDGKEKFGHCITADSGNSVGEISGHSSQINCVSIRQQRPLRAATGSDDTSLVFYHGAPFKFNSSLRKHNRFVYGVAFSPDGTSLVSVGADKKIWLYDGKTGEAKGQIGENVHQGSIFSVSWAKDSKRFVTSSADQTVKIWDVEAGKAVQSWRMGEEGSVSIPDHQVGVVWPTGRSDGLVISLNLAGDLNYLQEGMSKPQKVVQGHQKNITAVAVDKDFTSDSTFFTGSSDGRICSWNPLVGVGETVDGNAHTNYVSGISSSGGRIFSVGWDDTLRSIDISARTFTGTFSKTDGQPKGVAISNNSAVIATHRSITLSTDGQTHESLPTKFGPTTIAANGTLIAVGGDDNALHIYSASLGPEKEIKDPSSLITALSFSPSGALLAVGFSSGKITVFDTQSWDTSITRWSSHTGRVTSIAWNVAGTHAVSGALDTNIFVWSIAKPGRRVKASNAHKDGVNGVAWIGDGKVVSVGGDAAVKTWAVEVGE
ncbi:WD40 repeat-like protein [Lobaria immixta]|nr:WD40 repeat-like protein [Lobaria immixta]